ncbi:asparagine synthase [Kineobactrum sediminis]|uniref:asparagine synthase (glutamine-hydrolyzing) n=1 Tax=Kineobactrum sediminis TaxID=1905677 RepID=A0A2N5XZE5_9GAMM|nr:asparagine synthase-related protein [Kineobactrum sediminis]PLW81512.1 asparagine synthase [Kineobactrum sediminis]
MWILTDETTPPPTGVRWLTFAAQPSRTNSTRLNIVTEHPSLLCEDDRFHAIVLGRLRPYGQDYGLEQPGTWFLEQFHGAPTHFYSKVAGFFAIILLDKDSGNIHLISDHVGSVPLYTATEANQWWITDSLKLLEPHLPAISKSLNAQAIYNYCFFHCIPSPGAIYKSFTKLQPGEQVDVDLTGKSTRRNLYKPPYNYSPAAPAILMAECRQVIRDAVRRNIAPATGAFLSGGLDSSTVAGMFAEQQPGAPTFAIGFHAEGYDESAYARTTARHFQTTHHEHYLQPAEISDNFSAVAGFFDEPFGNSSAMAAFICAQVARDHGVDVLLAGDGGDEIFAGNERYAKQKLFELWGRAPTALSGPLEALLSTQLGELPLLRKGRSYIEQASVPLPDRMDSWNFLNRFEPSHVFEESFLAKIDASTPSREKRSRYEQCPSQDPVERMMYLDWKFTLADNDLVKVSSMCRKAGVEVRYPLFEKEVVDFSCTIPARVKLPGSKLRNFYKNSFREFLPETTLNKEKHGFGLPFGLWMKEQPALQQLTDETLKKLKQRGIFRPDFIEDAITNHKSGHSGYFGELIWIMVSLEFWLASRSP